MTSNQPAEPPTAMRTLERLSEISDGRVTATSPDGRAKVTLQAGKYSVELRADGFQDLDPRDLAEEVTHAVYGTSRGRRQAERTVLDAYRAHRPKRPPRPESERARIRNAQESVSVTAISASRMVRGSWGVTGGLRLKIAAVNAAHRERLATEISTVLNQLSEGFRAELKRATGEAKRRLRADGLP
ncbi:MAG TPA: hypothetical protein VE172_10020 [Stackebrandtia sp.]|uniref:hypothetical protein n=1 Tax=Stackebrandtia sp. TaxID=2023065 RepID=UPI002D2D9E76|nr:hypothetical protein [Stackebrandtia sp.]HZE39133.1 hypothetical protein [Stackebrandtia sp.]